MTDPQTTCQICSAPLCYTNGAEPGVGTPPMNPSNSGRNRDLVCSAVYRTGAHDARYYGDAGMCDVDGCLLRADWQAEVSGPRYCGNHAPESNAQRIHSEQRWTWACVWATSGRQFASDLAWDMTDALAYGRLAAGSSDWTVRRILVWVAK